MSNYDLIAFDMDGTLLDSKKQILPDSLKMIDKALKNKKYVCLSTGRSLKELEQFKNQLKNINYYICLSGAVIWDVQNQKPIYSNPIPEKIIRELFKCVQDFDLMVHILSENSIVQKDKAQNMEKYHMGVYQNMFDKITTQTDNIQDFFEKNPVPVYKINFYCRTSEERQKVLEKVSFLDLSFAFAENTSLECSYKGVTKGTGLKILCKKLNLPVEKTIAVGDADNDLEILKTAGLAVAMGNANENVKKIASKVVKSNDDGGCAQAIQDFLL